MRDREIAASLATGDPDGLAAAYDRHAAGLYGYCRSLLGEPADAADAVQDTFIIAAARADELRDPDRLRPWLYAIARNEGQCRLRAGAWPAQADAAGDLAAAPVTIEGTVVDSSQAELRYLVLEALGRLSPEDREVAELSRRHGLADSDLAAVLGVPVSQARALAAKTAEELDRSLGTLLVAGTGGGQCAGLDALLDGWDGRPTVVWRARAGRHIDGCDACGERRRRVLRPATLLRLVPLALLPDSLREHVLWLVPDDSPEAAAYRDEVISRTGPADPAGFPVQAVPAGGPGRAGRPGQDGGAPGPRPGRWRGGDHPAWRRLVVVAALLFLAGGAAAFVLHGRSAPGAAAADSAGTRAPVPASGAPGRSAPPGVPVPDPGRPISGGPTPGSSAPAATSSAPAPRTSAPSSAPARPAPPRPAPPPKPAPPPVLSEAPGTVSMAETGAGTFTGSFTLSAANGPVSFSVSAPSGVTVSESSGTVRPGAPLTIRVTYQLPLVAVPPSALFVNNITVSLSYHT
jgi:RNA polymerase sigma factor (sigma-70 family)